MKTIADPLKTEIFKANKEYIQQNKIEPFVLKEFMEFFETGKRLRYESSYFARRRQLVVAALAYFYEKNSENKEWLEQLIWEVCNEWTWALTCQSKFYPMIKQGFISTYFLLKRDRH
ncbi:hypothetical protein [Enterococcus faecium]|uniref:hypothetical protein n=1 Tax=Enterococcus faecium TaxID=1352 RepID=UPI002157AA68|nr:hypothetical protein [Enterococcus faecium]